MITQAAAPAVEEQRFLLAEQGPSPMWESSVPQEYTPVLGRRRGMVLSVVTGRQRSSMAVELAAHLALTLKEEKRTVCIVALEGNQTSDLGKFIHCYHPNLCDIAQSPAPLTEEQLLKSMVHRSKWNLSFLLASPRRDVPEGVDPNRLYQEILPLLQQMFDYVIVDAVAGESDQLLREVILPTSAHVITVVTSIEGHPQRARNWMEEHLTQESSAGVFLIGVGKGLSQKECAALLAPYEVQGYFPVEAQQPRSRSPEITALKGDPAYAAVLDGLLHDVTSERTLTIPRFPLEKQSRHGRVRRLFR